MIFCMETHQLARDVATGMWECPEEVFDGKVVGKKTSAFLW